MFEHVIVPLDGSALADRALAPAHLLTESTGASLVLVRAVYPDDLDQATEDLKQRALGLDAPDAELVLDSANDPVGAITEAVASREPCLVCMSTHGRSGIGRTLFGSVAEAALDEAGVPFVLVGPSADVESLQLGDVVVPLDGSHRAESILPVVTAWARATSAAVWLVEVVDPKAAEEVREEGEDLEEGAYVERIAATLPDDIDAEWEVLHGKDPGKAVCEFAAERGIPVVALATHGRTGVSRIMEGSVATSIVREHSGVVLAIRTPEPEG